MLAVLAVRARRRRRCGSGSACQLLLLPEVGGQVQALGLECSQHCLQSACVCTSAAMKSRGEGAGYYV